MEKFNEMGKPQRNLKESIEQATSYKQGATVGAATGNTKLRTIEVTDRAACIIKTYREAGYIDDLKIRAFDLLRLAFGECDAWIYDEQAKRAASIVFDMVSEVEELAKD